MIELDGTETKSRLGANAILGVSMAALKASAINAGKELFEYIGAGKTLPVPMMNIINGGAHADNNLDFQEYMIIPQRDTIHERVRVGAEVFHSLKKVLNEKIQEGKIIVKDIEVNGTENLLKLLKDDLKIVTIFLRVPKDELRRRLENRIEKASIKEIELRLNRFDYEESKIGLYDYVIKNDDLEKTVQIIMTIIKGEYNLK